MALDHGTVNFDILMEHYCAAFSRKAQKADDATRAQTRAVLGEMLEKFEAKHGLIKSQSWWPDIRAGAILTDRDEYFSSGNPFDEKNELKLERQSGDIDRLARRVRDLLSGPMRRNSLELIFSVRAAAFELLDQLDAIDAKREPQKAKDLREFIELRLDQDLRVAEDYTEGAIRRRGQLLYLGGMGAGVAVLLAIVAVLAWMFGRGGTIPGTETIPATLLLGALGAVVSVMQRLTQGRLRTNLDSGLIAVFLLGAFRPAIGSIFGFAILALVLGGLIPLDVPGDDRRAFFFGGLAFLAGFSERFAQDMLGSAKGVGATATVTATASAQTPAAPDAGATAAGGTGPAGEPTAAAEAATT